MLERSFGPRHLVSQGPKDLALKSGMNVHSWTFITAILCYYFGEAPKGPYRMMNVHEWTFIMLLENRASLREAALL